METEPNRTEPKPVRAAPKVSGNSFSLCCRFFHKNQWKQDEIRNNLIAYRHATFTSKNPNPNRNLNGYEFYAIH